MRYLVSLLILTFPASAQTALGTYSTRGDDRPVVLTLTEQRDGSVTGTLMIDDTRFPVAARYLADGLVGSVTVDRMDLYLEMTFEGDGLTLTLMDLDRAGRPRPTTAQRFELTSRDRPPPETNPYTPPTPPAGPRPYRRPPYPTPIGPFGSYAFDPMLGRFSDGYVHLDLMGSNDRYEGSFTVMGTTYPVQITRGAGGEFYGGYWANGVEVPLVVALAVDGVTVTVDGRLRLLRRVDGTPGSGRSGRLPYPGAGAPVLPVGPYPYRESYLTEWLAGKAVYFPDPLARDTRYGVMSRRVLHLCYGGDLVVEDRDAVRGVDPLRPGAREPIKYTGRWQLLWDDTQLDLEIRFEGRIDRYELTFDAAAAHANGDPVLIGYSDYCR